MSNHLANEKSLYLQMHSNNPVNWYPWCDEAFRKAKKENKPVFLSVGYSACHWCNVMARENFEDEGAAKILNDNFVAVKVDREERPDIDAVYTMASNALGQEGGWPLNVFLTPQKKPFFSGGYLPREDRHGEIGFKSLLLRVKDAWEHKSDGIMESASRVSEFLNKEEPKKHIPITNNTAQDAVEKLLAIEDKKYGGIGTSTKFPLIHTVMFLLKYFECTMNKDALDMAENTLLAMYKGGIHDHIGKGFFRYATDREWEIPHFEKMLIDNAYICLGYAKAFEVTKKQMYLSCAKECADFILEDLKCENGGFYTSLGAESKDGEGAFYIWLPKEINQILGSERGTKFCEYYSITDRWDFKGKCIPHIEGQVLINPFVQEAQEVKKVRDEKRKKPSIDKKILTHANAVVVVALASLYKISGEEKYLNEAISACDFIISNMKDQSGRLLAGINEREVKGFSEDYVNLTWAVMTLYEITHEKKYLDEAISLTKDTLSYFMSSLGGLNFYGNDQERLIAPLNDAYDGATPSPNSVFLLTLKMLYRATLNPLYQSTYYGILEHFGGECNMMSANHAFMLYAFL